jgi:hypothetical protein
MDDDLGSREDRPEKRKFETESLETSGPECTVICNHETEKHKQLES